MDLNIYKDLFLAGIIQGFVFLYSFCFSQNVQHQKHLLLDPIDFSPSRSNPCFSLFKALVIKVEQRHPPEHVPRI